MKNHALIPTSLLILFILVGCTRNGQLTPTVDQTPFELQTPVETESPTATTLPSALLVNGEGILVSEYEAELLRLQDALTELEMEMTPEDQKSRVLESFIDELLLAQAAAAAGHTVGDAELQARIDQLLTDMGGAEKLAEWQDINHYTDEMFRTALKRQMAAALQRDNIANAVPETAEQIHARQLFYKNEANAVIALKQLTDGVEFDTLAYQQDPTLGGDLGWFPRGMLTQPEVEDVVFTLQPGETSGIIASGLGYHIVHVIEREPDHLLSTEARLMLQKAALADWLSSARAGSTIEILVP
ncbi:MAG: peptidylprolyl isomerase [Anaerolineaceae bacterium]|jgi:parvulin-like peptidyl-prolyl isomerase